MEKDELLQALSNISDVCFQKKDYISAGMINRAIDVVNDYQGILMPQTDVIKSVCDTPCDELRTACDKCKTDYYKWAGSQPQSELEDSED